MIVTKAALRLLVAIVLLLTLLPTSSGIKAQDDPCLQLVEKIFAQVGQTCTDLKRDSVCYGHVKLSAEAREGVDLSTFTFETAGDMVSLKDLKTLKLGEMNLDNEEWGIAFIRLRANLPDVAAGQFVTMIAFGDTEIWEAADNAGAPMQAFYVRTGVGEKEICGKLPTDGILLQTPAGAGKIALTINEVRLNIGSTILIQAPPATAYHPSMMRIFTYMGEVEASWMAAGDKKESSTYAKKGQQIIVPLDDKQRPVAPPINQCGTDFMYGISYLNEYATKSGLFPPEVVDPADSTKMSVSYSKSGRTYTFTDKSTIPPEAKVKDRVWEFGDGEKMSGEKVSHTYTYGGTYELIYTIYFESGVTKSMHIPLEVEGPAKPELIPADTPSCEGTIKGTANIRTGPSRDFEAITKFSDGTLVKIIGIVPPGEWYKLVMKELTPAYVSTELVKDVKCSAGFTLPEVK